MTKVTYCSFKEEKTSSVHEELYTDLYRREPRAQWSPTRRELCNMWLHKRGGFQATASATDFLYLMFGGLEA